MKPIQIEAVSADDAEAIVSYLYQTPHNLHDPGVFFYPQTAILKATQGEDVIAFLPAQLTITLDAFAINPSATKMQKARAMRKLFLAFADYARQQGVKEINFFTADDSTAEFAKRQGVEEVSQRLFRYKVPDGPESQRG